MKYSLTKYILMSSTIDNRLINDFVKLKKIVILFGNLSNINNTILLAS